MYYKCPISNPQDFGFEDDEMTEVWDFVTQEFASSLTDRRKYDRRESDRRGGSDSEYSGEDRRRDERRKDDRRICRGDARLLVLNIKYFALISAIRNAGNSKGTKS